MCVISSYKICFMSPFWCLESGDGSRIFKKFADPSSQFRVNPNTELDVVGFFIRSSEYRGADKSLARPGRKQATATKL